MSSIPDDTTDGNFPASYAGRQQRPIDLYEANENLIVMAGENRHEVDVYNLDVDGQEQHIRSMWAGADELVFSIDALPRWSHETRWSVLQFISRTDQPYHVSTGSGERHSDLFAATRSMVVRDGNPESMERRIRAVVESAAIVCPDALTPACSEILQRLRDQGFQGYRMGDLVGQAHAARDAIDGAAQAQSEDFIFVVDCLPGPPVLQHAVVPHGFQISQVGVGKSGSDSEEPFLSTPLLITRRLMNTDQTESLELAWLRDNQWRQRVVPRVLVATTRTIVELASYGVPVNGHNAQETMRYLADFESENIEILPRDLITRQMGWQGADNSGFLCGRTLITSDHSNDATMPAEDNAASVSTANDANANDTHPNITFQGGDDGEEQLANGFQPAGNFDAWSEAMESLASFPRVRIGVYAALCTVLIKLVDTYNFVLSYSGQTSQGKTTALRAAASVWGRPREDRQDAAIGTWDSTRVWVERAVAVQCDHPLIIDDTKRARRPDDIAQTIYDVASGRGRGRGSIDGIRSTDTFRTVLVSSGEAPITSFTQDGGTRARVLELWGSPFGEATAATASTVTALNETLRDNYGHAGPHFVRYVLEQRDNWPAWRERFGQARQRFVGLAGDNSVSLRMADHFALLELTVQLASEADAVPWPADDLICELWPTLTAEAAQADQATAALHYVWSWAGANQRDFFGRRRGCDQAPFKGWAGRWDSADNWEYLGFLKPRIEHLLQDQGFEPEPVLRSWRDRGWLKLSSGRNLYRARVDGVIQDLVAIERAVIEEHCCNDCGNDENTGPERSRPVIPSSADSSHQA